MKLEEITNGSSLEGVEPASVVTVVAATTTRPWSFDGDGAAFQLTVEAKGAEVS